MAQQTFNLPYRETPYQVTATRKFYHPQTKTVSINPTTPNPSLSFELVRKTGEWIYTEDSEVLPYGRTVVEDINVEPEDSYISEPGVDGLREFSEEREWIDGERTGEVRNVTETITQPVNEIYIQGTAVVTWELDIKRTEVIPFTTQEYNSSAHFKGERVVTQQGVDGVRSFFASQKYINGVPTGIFTDQETPQVTTQPITHRIAVGTVGLTLQYGNVGTYFLNAEGEKRYRPGYKILDPITSNKTYEVVIRGRRPNSSVEDVRVITEGTSEWKIIQSNVTSETVFTISGSVIGNHNFISWGAAGYPIEHFDNLSPVYQIFMREV